MEQKILEKIEKGKIYAIIPARSGSKGVRNKNIRMLNGYPMMAYAIAAAKMSKQIQRVIVSTDSEKYAEIARQFGAETPFLRPADISGDRAADIEFMCHAIEWFYENEDCLPEYWVQLRPTTPLRDVAVIDEAIRLFIKDKNADSLRSAYLTVLCPFKWFVMDESGHYKTFTGISFDEANQPRQNFPHVYIPDGYVDVLRTEHIVKSGSLHGTNMTAFRSPESIDIDNVKDVEALESIVQKFRGDILEYLHSIVTED